MKRKLEINSILVIAKPSSGCGDPEKATLDDQDALWAPRHDGGGLFFKDFLPPNF